MMDRKFEEDLTRVLSAKADWRAPVNLQLRVAAVPDEITSPSRPLAWVGRVPRVARFAAVALVVALAVGSAWYRYEIGSPGSGGAPLMIQTEAEPAPLPNGAVWACPLPRSSLSLRVGRSGSELVVTSTTTGDQVNAVWPHGFSARLVDGKAELLASDGTVVAREGDVLDGVIGAIQDPGSALHINAFNGTCYLPSGDKIKVG